MDRGAWITAPQFPHGEYLISGSRPRESALLCRRKVADLHTGRDGKKRNKETGGERLGIDEIFEATAKTFAYVETLEPLPSIFDFNSRVQ
ncbi:hypothetical protein U9M48_012665 [Paspalum notatum var. saurae]|uniref:Uncharacterized protein n=1 Tax=Paspalum notatum var. saurae TaxID=547442 RepID=A0AAQ3T0L4_PASNO